MKNKNFTEKQKDQIFLLKSLNYSWDNIGEILERSPYSVRNLFSREKILRSLPPKTKTSKSLIKGRLATLTKRIVNDNPQISYRSIPGAVKAIIGSDEEILGYKSFETFLKKSGYVRVKLAKKPLLSAINMHKRLEFAKNYLQKGPGFWDHVIWSDETMVRSLPKSQDKFHKVHFSVKRTNLPVNPQIQNGGFSVMFWGCFSKVGLGPLVALHENLNSANYLNL